MATEDESWKRRQQFIEQHALGATGRNMPGRTRPEDEGELRACVRIEGQRLEILFGRSLSFVSMNKQQAIEFAKAIVEIAEKMP